MYAVIATGGKQYKVSEGDIVRVEKLAGEVGSKVEISDVLLVGEEGATKIGTPTVEKAKVSGEIVEQGKDKKILVFKKKRRKGYKKLQGHRQQYTALKIEKIKA
ncbi:MAG: 50S ribosomal protein L21 [Deltaproteobacteria bacterium]|nr:50S ribosomal protein L21 [Deltaproteobacteria bacterium]